MVVSAGKIINKIFPDVLQHLFSNYLELIEIKVIDTSDNYILEFNNIWYCKIIELDLNFNWLD